MSVAALLLATARNADTETAVRIAISAEGRFWPLALDISRLIFPHPR